MGTGYYLYQAEFERRRQEKSAERDALNAKVKKLRAEGMTYKAIAQRLGCSPSRVGMLLKGTKWFEARP